MYLNVKSVKYYPRKKYIIYEDYNREGKVERYLLSFKKVEIREALPEFDLVVLNDVEIVKKPKDGMIELINSAEGRYRCYKWGKDNHFFAFKDYEFTAGKMKDLASAKLVYEVEG